MRTALSVFIALALVATTGCSFSNSSGSISDSISSPSTSISESSSGGDSGDDEKEPTPAPESTEETARYQQDVSQLALTYLKSGGELDAFRAAITDLAKARGITDWESDAETAQAIGVGAGNAGLQEAAFDDFSKQLFGDDLTKLNEIRIGYQQSAPAPAQQATTPATTEMDSSSQSETPAEPEAAAETS